MQSPRSRRVGDEKVRRQKGVLPDFRDAFKTARALREGDRVKRASKGQSLICVPVRLCQNCNGGADTVPSDRKTAPLC
jgi:hypothetical protein